MLRFLWIRVSDKTVDRHFLRCAIFLVSATEEGAIIDQNGSSLVDHTPILVVVPLPGPATILTLGHEDIVEKNQF